MQENDFINEYKAEFDKIHASDDLKRAVTELKPQKPYRITTPFKAVIGTAAAAFMIFAAVHEYSFEPDTSGVISETVVSTELPEAQFEIVEKKHEPMPTKAAATHVPKPAETAAVTPRPVKASTPQPTVIPTAVPTVQPEAEAEAAPAALTLEEETTPVARSGGGGGAVSTLDMWTVSEYYSYLGADVSARLGASYTGTQLLEFRINEAGTPVDDTAVLAFMTADGASISATVSKSPIFDASLSGTVMSVTDGFNAYKVSGGVYYNLYISNTTEEAAKAIINRL